MLIYIHVVVVKWKAKISAQVDLVPNPMHSRQIIAAEIGGY